MPSAAFKKALASIQKNCGDVIKDVSVAGKIERLVTDSPRLNYIFGGGIPLGRIHRLIGPESGGKSTLCTYVASQFQKHLKEQLGYDKPYCVYMDFERSFDESHAKELGLLTDPDHFIFMRPDDLESGSAALEELVKTGEVATIIFDSESMACTKTVMADELGKPTFGAGARIMKDFCNRFAVLCSNYNTTLLVISQERANMQMMSHAVTTTGGTALKYAASTLTRVKKIETLQDGGVDIGIHMNVRNMKSKISIPWRQCDMDLIFKNGIDSTSQYVDYIKDFADDTRLNKLVTLGGAYYKSEKFGFSICGRAKMVEFAKADSSEWKEIRKAIDDIITSENSLDITRVDPEADSDDVVKRIAAEEKAAEEKEAADKEEEKKVVKRTKNKKLAEEALVTDEDDSEDGEPPAINL